MDYITKVQGEVFQMKSVKKKLSLLLVLVLLVNMLLPGMSALAVEGNNSVVLSELNNASSEHTLLSPDTSNQGNQNGTPHSSPRADLRENSAGGQIGNERYVQPQNAANIIRLILQAMRAIGPVGSRVWSKVKPWVDEAINNIQKYTLDGPGGGRIFQVRDRRTNYIYFRLDYHTIRSSNAFLHFHQGSSDVHYIIWPQPTQQQWQTWNRFGIKAIYVGEEIPLP